LFNLKLVKNNTIFLKVNLYLEDDPYMNRPILILTQLLFCIVQDVTRCLFCHSKSTEGIASCK